MIDDEKVNLGPFATLFGHGFGFFDDRKARSRGPGSAFGPARRFSAHFGCLGGCAPSVARIPVMARRTCRGVTGRVLLSHGRRTAATTGRANTNWFCTAAKSLVQRSNCSGVRRRGWAQSRSCECPR